jgi:hypothetical protein
MQIKCFPDEAKVKGTETVYEVHGSYEFPLKLKKNMLKLEEQKEAKFYKCIACDQMNRIISTQLYIITTYGKSVMYCFIFVNQTAGGDQLQKC